MFTPPDHHLIRTVNKRGIDKAWQKNPLSLADFNDWIGSDPTNTVGLVCSGDIVVLDIDNDKYLNDLNEATVDQLLAWEFLLGKSIPSQQRDKDCRDHRQSCHD